MSHNTLPTEWHRYLVMKAFYSTWVDLLELGINLPEPSKQTKAQASMEIVHGGQPES